MRADQVESDVLHNSLAHGTEGPQGVDSTQQSHAAPSHLQE